MAERRLPDFISGFCKFAETYNTTPHFAQATAVWMVGTVVTRAVAMRSRGNSLSPNMFIQLVGGPGTGKSQAITAGRSILLKAVNGLSLIPASVTRAGMEDYMVGNLQQRRTPDGQLLLSNECIGLSEEMQGILPDQDLGHLTLYNILYDLPQLHIAQTRTHGEVRLEAPYCSILTGAQPAFLALSIPEGAWGMGFMSRSMMIFDQPRERRSMFEFQDVDNKLKADLIHDLKTIATLCGWVQWSKEAVALYHEWWVRHGGQPVPTAKRLAMGYNSRREIHFAKLAMVMSLSRSDELIVQLEDVQEAITFLITVEDRMKFVFNEMASTGSMIAIEEAIDMVRAATAEGKAVDEAQIISFLMQRFPSTQVHSLVTNLIQSKAIKNVGGLDVTGMRKFQLGTASGSLS